MPEATGTTDNLRTLMTEMQTLQADIHSRLDNMGIAPIDIDIFSNEPIAPLTAVPEADTPVLTLAGNESGVNERINRRRKNSVRTLAAAAVSTVVMGGAAMAAMVGGGSAREQVSTDEAAGAVTGDSLVPTTEEMSQDTALELDGLQLAASVSDGLDEQGVEQDFHIAGMGSCSVYTRADGLAAARGDLNPTESILDLQVAMLEQNPALADNMGETSQRIMHASYYEALGIDTTDPGEAITDYFANTDYVTAELVNNVSNVQNTYCDLNGNVIDYRATTLEAGTHVGGLFINNIRTENGVRVATLDNGENVVITDRAVLADVYVLNENGERVVRQMLATNKAGVAANNGELVGCMNFITNIPTPPARPPRTTVPPEITTTVPPETTTTVPDTTTTVPEETTTTTQPEETTTTTVPEETTTTTQPEETTTTTVPEEDEEDEEDKVPRPTPTVPEFPDQEEGDPGEDPDVSDTGNTGQDEDGYLPGENPNETVPPLPEAEQPDPPINPEDDPSDGTVPVPAMVLPAGLIMTATGKLARKAKLIRQSR